ncbi:MAG: bifunctional phosphoribosylaminoimidazolecarboxamide formyltransferase/IMP cyclohydrolase [Lentimicrobium sp.]|jgi:phosphoribosylaminoimidazolecarboxamide formyltransferase/IMP cyclohydrolase|nr:bifunctional phosphoribosylaminoimidazolecarboxamide formyltransferase/IMP cyclohydrolase [Lentimicrobium sp.]MDD2528281.1 bifunctional phosphoribosylaminoimidazolecarboxamide formyltransferase/IMP cyclohydrolase [Lentimicrobiaceae bacterium]MDY0025184.1 bifunctional phosphoribosylaminoimidazolecarboxamide formyltransferase/IMP cyclohydrolase [Lentimicrobium sp.]
MLNEKKITTALISVFHKEGLPPIIHLLHQLGVRLYSTGGTEQFIRSLGVEVQTVESLTDYPSILDGRVKTLHPKVFGGILAKRNDQTHQSQLKQYNIPYIDLVIVDLYPFEETLATGASENEIIEKIDIGGISLIRAAAKNFEHVLIVPASKHYHELAEILNRNAGTTFRSERQRFAAYAFAESSRYDTAIFNWYSSRSGYDEFRLARSGAIPLRYGENPHQSGVFYGQLDKLFTQLHGKALSYNNLLDVEAAMALIADFHETTFAIIKHNNACGLASRPKLIDAWTAALAGDPLSAFGGVLITNAKVDENTAKEINKLFFEIILAPGYEKNTIEVLSTKKNRIILQVNSFDFQGKQFRSLLNGVLQQDKDTVSETPDQLRVVTNTAPADAVIEDLLFANKIVKHSKSNAIVLAREKQLLGSGMGQTSRVDALKQAIAKADQFGLSLKNGVMASDAFFPFADSVQMAHKAGITAVIQPGGSLRDAESIDYCNENEISMVFTGIRHFKH